MIRESLENTHVQTTTRESFQTILFIRETIENICYKLQPEKLLRTILKTFIRNYFKQYTHYYEKNHSKQILETTTRDSIAKSTYKLLSENHSKQYLQTISTEDE